MPVGQGGESIKDWTVTQLVRMVKSILESDPVSFISSLTVDELRVVRKLTVEDEAAFSASNTWRVFGSTGGPALTNGWVAYGAPYAKPAALKDALGFVNLTGVAKSGTVGSALTTLPPGFRPPFDLVVAVISNGALGRVDVLANGQIIPMSPSSNASVVLDNIRFKAA